MFRMTRAWAALLTACALMISSAVHAADFPAKPIRLIVPFAPGGSTDIVARLVAQEASTRIGQPIVVENRPGASATIGTSAVIRAEPDGYTLLLGSTPVALQTLLSPKPAFDVQRDLVAVANVASAPFVWTVNAALPVKTFADFVAYARANASTASFGTSGVGSSAHLAGELVNLRTGTKLLHVLYKSESEAITSLLGGYVMAVPASYSTLAGQLSSGKLRPLAVTSRARMKVLPNVPTVDESGVSGYQIEYWNGIFAPAKTPPEIVEKLSTVLTSSIRSPQVSRKLEELGFAVEAAPTAEFTSQIDSDIRRWRELIKAAGVVIER